MCSMLTWGYNLTGVYEGEEHDHGVGVGVNTTLLSDTLQSIGLAESAVGRAKV